MFLIGWSNTLCINYKLWIIRNLQILTRKIPLFEANRAAFPINPEWSKYSHQCCHREICREMNAKREFIILSAEFPSFDHDIDLNQICLNWNSYLVFCVFLFFFFQAVFFYQSFYDTLITFSCFLYKEKFRFLITQTRGDDEVILNVASRQPLRKSYFGCYLARNNFFQTHSSFFRVCYAQ